MENMGNKKTSTPLYFVGLLIVAAIQLVGFALLWDKTTTQPEYVYLPAANNDQPAIAGVPPTIAIDKTLIENTLREAIQSALKQELAPYARQLTATSDAPPKTLPADSPGVKENSPENSQALTAVTSIVSHAIAQGKWTTTDFAALLPHAHQLTSEQRYKIMDEIADAVNRQELELETPFPLL
jgi:ABC-type transporter Mla subunit MlaD